MPFGKPLKVRPLKLELKFKLLVIHMIWIISLLDQEILVQSRMSEVLGLGQKIDPVSELLLLGS